ncbi:hypothetical protein ON058_06665 [Demequina sp. B12]|uniref:hypothetical protein n=1 Tax=Demequina sp. B12 TaxID=2992757 RepID=UPI00237AA78C|nr:hypothetical protein [Demequina sp. B12]MDE0573092.1 hypothetical protein [Demequina sp. B12]
MSDARSYQATEFVINGQVSNLDGPLIVPSPDARNWLAVTAIISSVIVPPLGVLLGHRAMREVRQGRATNRALAARALLLSYQVLALMWALATVLMMSVPGIAIAMCVALGLSSLAGVAMALTMFRDHDKHTPAESRRALLTAGYCLMLSVVLIPGYGAVQSILDRSLQ